MYGNHQLVLSSTTIANPIGLYTVPSEGIVYKVLVYNGAGCVDSAAVKVKVFATLSMVFIAPMHLHPMQTDAMTYYDLLLPVFIILISLLYTTAGDRWYFQQ